MLDPLARRGYTSSAGKLAGRRDSGRLSLRFFHHLNRRSRRQESAMIETGANYMSTLILISNLCIGRWTRR